jgi:hypothetical protein
VQKNFLKLVFVGVLKVNDENGRIRIGLVRGLDPRIRIRIHTKMSWIRKYRDNEPSVENVGRKLRNRKGEPRRPEIMKGGKFQSYLPSRGPQGGEGGASSIIINTGYHQEIRM